MLWDIELFHLSDLFHVYYQSKKIAKIPMVLAFKKILEGSGEVKQTLEKALQASNLCSRGAVAELRRKVWRTGVELGVLTWLSLCCV